MAYVLVFPASCKESVIKGLKLFFESVFPSLFPFFVLSSFASKTKIAENMGKPLEAVPKMMGISSGRYVYLTSVLSGYPTSAKLVSEGYTAGKITKNDARILYILASNGSAAFIASFVGSLYNDVKITVILLLANYISPVISAYRLSVNVPPRQVPAIWADEKNTPAGYLDAFISSVSESLVSVMNVGGFVIIFSVINGMTEIFPDFFPVKILCSFLELSNGCGIIAGADMPVSIKVALTGALISFGGVCVMFQNLSFMRITDIGTDEFVRYKIFSGFAGGIISYFLAAVFRIAEPVSVSYPQNFLSVKYTELNILLLALFVTIILYTFINYTLEENNEHKRHFKTGGKSS